MEQNILLFTILGLTFVTALSQLFLLILNSLKKNERSKPSDLFSPYYEKSETVLHDAQIKANKILTNAELKGIEFIAKQKLAMDKLIAELDVQIKSLEEKLIVELKASMDKTEKSYQDYLSVLEENLKHQEMQNQRFFQEKTQKMIDNSQQIMSAFILDINAKVKRQIDEEFALVKNELDLYKKHRMEVINKNIIDILEKTLEQTLVKKLSLSEHSEIIFQALEQAKQEHNLT